MRDPGFNTVTTLASLDYAARTLPAPWDVLADPSVEDLELAGFALLPRGAAWGTPDAVALDPQSRFAGMVRALLSPFVGLYYRAFRLARESSPAMVDLLLDEWEADYGLPDPCITTVQTRGERLAFLAAKVNAAPLVTPGDFIRLAAAYGFEIEIEEPVVFELGFSELGGEHTVGDWRQEVYWIVRVQDVAVYYFTLSESELAEDPLFSYGEAEQLLCLLSRLAPAWTIPVLQAS